MLHIITIWLLDCAEKLRLKIVNSVRGSGGIFPTAMLKVIQRELWEESFFPFSAAGLLDLNLHVNNMWSPLQGKVLHFTKLCMLQLGGWM